MHPLLLWLVAINMGTFLVYGYDKFLATRGVWRISERVLLLLALIGGSLGALVAMQVFRHKTIKSSFRLQLWGVIAIQIMLLLLYLVLFL